MLRIYEALHADTVLLNPGDTEKGRVRAQSQHQMVVGKLQAAAGLYALALEIHALQLRPSEAGAELNQGPPERLCDVLGLHVAAYDPRHHRPVGEEVLLVDDHDPDIVAVLGQVTKGLRHREASEPAAHDEHPVGELRKRDPLPWLVFGLRLVAYGPPQNLRGDGAPSYREATLEQFIHALSIIALLHL